MYYEILAGSAGYLPNPALRMDVDGLFITLEGALLISRNTDGTCIAVIHPQSDLNSIIKCFAGVQTDAENTYRVLLSSSDNQEHNLLLTKLTKLLNVERLESIETDSSSALVKASGEIIDDPAAVSKEEFNIITPPERKKRVVLHTLNKLFSPLVGLSVPIEIQFTGEQYNPAPPLLLSQLEMKEIAKQHPDRSELFHTLKAGLCMGLFDLNLSRMPQNRLR